jgi:hypothetical protein
LMSLPSSQLLLLSVVASFLVFRYVLNIHLQICRRLLNSSQPLLHNFVANLLWSIQLLLLASTFDPSVVN